MQVYRFLCRRAEMRCCIPGDWWTSSQHKKARSPPPPPVTSVWKGGRLGRIPGWVRQSKVPIVPHKCVYPLFSPFFCYTVLHCFNNVVSLPLRMAAEQTLSSNLSSTLEVPLKRTQHLPTTPQSAQESYSMTVQSNHSTTFPVCRLQSCHLPLPTAFASSALSPGARRAASPPRDTLRTGPIIIEVPQP